MLFSLFSCLLFLFSTSLVQANDPIVLVHGLGGDPWNWGYERELKSAGFDVYNTKVGKFTSAWDRACEVYAQIKGTRVDFGVCHSREAGHSQFGKDFTGKGFYPEWDENNRVHLFGHSFGGPTITLLEKILEEGSGCPEDTNPLFQGGRSMITSISTFSGVLAGASFVDDLDESGLTNLIENFVFFFAGLLDNSIFEGLYDIDFGHWGLEQGEDESLSDYLDRVKESGILDPSNTDISTYDISKKGAREINAFGRHAYPNTHYFSHATERTNTRRNCFLLNCGEPFERASPFMSIFFIPFANKIGSLDTAPEERENDGLVNWINQICPITEESDRENCEEFDEVWEPGKWYYADLDSLDHLQIVLRNIVDDTLVYGNSAKKIYNRHAKRLDKMEFGKTVRFEDGFYGDDSEDLEIIGTSNSVLRYQDMADTMIEELENEKNFLTRAESSFIISMVFIGNALLFIGFYFTMKKKMKRYGANGKDIDYSGGTVQTVTL